MSTAARPPIRVIGTNDFLAAVAPAPTSFGALPGGTALLHRVDALRSDRPAVWIDAGDFAQGGPLVPLCGPRAGFSVYDGFGADAAVAGNHEFDWGVPHLSSVVAGMRTPLLCANVDAGLPGHCLVEVAGYGVGIVGATHPQLATLTRDAVPTCEDPVPSLLRELDAVRDADLVVAVIHDGVDWSPNGTSGPQMSPDRFLHAYAPILDRADVVVAGHTHGRWIGSLAGTPVLQPWPFGCELAVWDFPSGDWGGVPVSARAPWQGFGASAIAAAQRNVLGELPSPLVSAPGRTAALQDWMASAVLAANGVDAALVPGFTLPVHQPPMDGVVAYLAGTVTEADLLRLLPWRSTRVVTVPLSRDELATAVTAVSRTPFGRCGVARRATVSPVSRVSRVRRHAPVSRLRVAMEEFVVPAVERGVGRPLAPEPAPFGLSAAVRQRLGLSGKELHA